MIDQNQILSNTMIRQVFWYDSVTSTNTLAQELRSPLEQLPVLIGAEKQTQGRGRGGNQWWSSSGSLTFSLVIYPESWSIPRPQWPLISLVTGLSVTQALAPFAPNSEFLVKWPNDVYASDRKICGILLESHPAQSDQLIVGIGVNINNSFADAPEELRNRATSLTDLANIRFDRTEVLVQILKAINEELTRLGADPHQFLQRFRQRCLLRGRVVSVQESDREITGTCQGIDDDGALVILTELGRQRIIAGVVTQF